MENPLVWITKDARDFAFYDGISKVTVTDNCSSETMKAFLKYPIHATLIDKTSK